MWISVTGLGNHGFNWSAPGSGTGGDTGDYQLSVQELPTADLAFLANNSITLNTPTPITLGQTVTENIGSDNQTYIGADDVDIFSYTAPGDQLVVVRTFADQEGSADTYLRIFNAQGQELAANNDADATTKGSQITILLNAGQTYYIGVNGNGPGAADYDPLTGGNAKAGSTGNYSLLISEVAPSSPPIYATGADAGGGPHVRVFNAQTNAEIASFFAYNALFTGGVRVAVGDVTGDGIDDVVTAAGPGGGPHVRVFDGATLQFRTEDRYNFMAFQPNMTTGLNVAVGDVNGDGFADIILAPDAGSSPAVKVFSGKDGSVLLSFFAYNLGVTSGVRVAAGDVNGDGFADIITAPGPGFPINVRVFDSQVPQQGLGTDLLQSQGLRIGTFYAFPGFYGGAYVAAGDVNGDDLADIIVGAGPGGGPNVQVFNAANSEPFVLQNFFAYDPRFVGGVRVGASDFNFDHLAEIVTAPGPGGGPDVRLYDGRQTSTLDEQLNAYGGFIGGVFVAGGGNSQFPPQTQTLASTAEAALPAASPVKLSEVESLRSAAIARFADAGLSADELQQLQIVQFSLNDLPGRELGLSLPGTILLDFNAAGAGWFIDPTPFLDEEFTSRPNGNLAAIGSPANSGVDLLSVILHEFAHQLGGQDLNGDSFPNQLLADTIAPGERRLPMLSSLDAVFAGDDLFQNL